jgi:hypothetical protein
VNALDCPSAFDAISSGVVCPLADHDDARSDRRLLVAAAP